MAKVHVLNNPSHLDEASRILKRTGFAVYDLHTAPEEDIPANVKSTIQYKKSFIEVVKIQ